MTSPYQKKPFHLSFCPYVTFQPRLSSAYLNISNVIPGLTTEFYLVMLRYITLGFSLRSMQ